LFGSCDQRVLAYVADEPGCTIEGLGFAMPEADAVSVALDLIEAGYINAVRDRPYAPCALFVLHDPFKERAEQRARERAERQARARRRLAEFSALIESPAERSLWSEYLRSAPMRQRFSLSPQRQVGRYRLDFADITRKVAVEVDGLVYHNGQDSFIRDQQRQRDLQALGWTVIRFAAKEALDDPQRCLREIARLVEARC
jgi:very-short-patch-repair endonuclease